MSFLVLSFSSLSLLSRIIIANTFIDLTQTHSCRNSINAKRDLLLLLFANVRTYTHHVDTLVLAKHNQKRVIVREQTNTIDLRQSSSLTLPSDEEKRDRHISAQHQPTTSERAVAAAPTRRLSSSSCFIQSVIIHFSSFPLPPSANERARTHTHTRTYGARASIVCLSSSTALHRTLTRVTHTNTRVKLEWPL
jgi:hypothetical protein